MFFEKKKIKCDNCSSKVNDKYSFCPFCGYSRINQEKHARDYGLLGKEEDIKEIPANSLNFSLSDKLIGSIMNSLMKNLDKQFKQIDKEFGKTEVQSFPNWIRIKIGPANLDPKKNQKGSFKKQISQQQLDKMYTLPRIEAKSKVTRLSDKIIYELNAPGIQSPQDIFVSKLESGYEIKAIADKKIYVNSLPINLPLLTLSMNNNKLIIEFATHNQFQ